MFEAFSPEHKHHMETQRSQTRKVAAWCNDNITLVIGLKQLASVVQTRGAQLVRVVWNYSKVPVYRLHWSTFPVSCSEVYSVVNWSSSGWIVLQKGGWECCTQPHIGVCVCVRHCPTSGHMICSGTLWDLQHVHTWHQLGSSSSEDQRTHTLSLYSVSARHSVRCWRAFYLLLQSVPATVPVIQSSHGCHFLKAPLSLLSHRRLSKLSSCHVITVEANPQPLLILSVSKCLCLSWLFLNDCLTLVWPHYFQYY